MSNAVVLKPGQMRLAEWEAIYRQGLAAKLDAACFKSIQASAKVVADAAAGTAPVYGVNTGFGKNASFKIPPEDTALLQRNLIISTCCGVGAPTPEPIVRLMMALKLNSLGHGASGVRPRGRCTRS